MASGPITSWQIEEEKVEAVTYFILLGFKNHCRWWLSPSNWKMLTPQKESYDKPRQHIKKQRHHFADKGLYGQSFGFPVVMYRGFHGGSKDKESACSAGDPASIPGSGRPPGEGNGNPQQCSCLEKSHGWRSLVRYSPRGHKESDTTERLHSLTELGWRKTSSLFSSASNWKWAFPWVMNVNKQPTVTLAVPGNDQQQKSHTHSYRHHCRYLEILLMLTNSELQ